MRLPNRPVIKIERPIDAPQSETTDGVDSTPRRHREVAYRPRGPRDGSGGSASKGRGPAVLLGSCAILLVAAGVVFALTSARHASPTQAIVIPAGSKIETSTPIAVASTSTPAPRRPKAVHHTVAKSPKVTASAPAKVGVTRTVVNSTTAVAVPSMSGVVVIDAGHQAHGDPSLEPVGPGSSQTKPKVSDGASGQYAPHDESEVNLEVALKLERVLKAQGVKVIMVRTSQNVNIANSRRAAIANNAHAALFIRLHCDGISDSSKHGLSTLIPAKNQWTGPIVSKSAKAGRLVQHAALAATGASDAGVVNRGDLSGFNWAKVPTILVEMGFMSNRAEDHNLVSSAYQQKLATGLANGVVQYLKSR